LKTLIPSQKVWIFRAASFPGGSTCSNRNGSSAGGIVIFPAANAQFNFLKKLSIPVKTTSIKTMVIREEI
jgi:hypothetical protein